MSNEQTAGTSQPEKRPRPGDDDPLVLRMSRMTEFSVNGVVLGYGRISKGEYDMLSLNSPPHNVFLL